MANDIKLFWAPYTAVSEGLSYGYSKHTLKMQEATQHCPGLQTVSDPKDADICIHFVRAKLFEPIKGKVNLLFTMTEFAPPFSYRVCGLDRAQILVVPCRFCQATFRPYYSGTIELVPEGIDPSEFPFYERQAPMGGPFTFLWLGAWNGRKGNGDMIDAWKGWLRSGRMPWNARLIMKTSGVHEPGMETSRAKFSYKAWQGDFIQSERVPSLPLDLRELIVDTRNVSAEELRGMYRDAHAFVSPSLGEGWNLPLTEAMATGLPSIFTACTAMLDYGDESVGYPVGWKNIPVKSDDPPYELASGCEPDTQELIRKMEEVYYNYTAAIARGKKASERMRTYFSWEQAALKFRNICRKYVPKTAIAPSVATAAK